MSGQGGREDIDARFEKTSYSRYGARRPQGRENYREETRVFEERDSFGKSFPKRRQEDVRFERREEDVRFEEIRGSRKDRRSDDIDIEVDVERRRYV